MALEPKELRFVSEYVGDAKQNATAAVIRAGYSKRSARQIASRLLSKDDIQSEIKKRMGKVAAKNEITAERLDASLLALAEADIRKAFDPDGTPLKIHAIPDDVAKAIAGVEIDEDGHITKFKFAEKVRPLEILLKRHGLLKDLHEHTGKDGEPLTPAGPKIVLLEKLTLNELKGIAGMRIAKARNGTEATPLHTP